MAFDFPAAPVLDQTYTAHGVTFRWNSYAWVQVGAVYAPVASPVFTGDPQAPTPATADNDNSLATTAFVKAQSYITASALTPYAPLASPALSGNPTAPTPAAADNDTSIATTAFVQGELTAKAPLASPTFTGDPKAPTPLTADNDTSIATTAFVKAQGYVTGGPYQPLDADLTAIAALAGTNVIYYRSAADTWATVTVSTGLSFSGGTLSCTVSTAGLAPLASPVFTGDPQAPTPATADNDTSIATTAFVKAQGYITSSALVSYAPLASPVFTGNPTAPTPTAGDNDTSVATTAFVQGELLGKVAKTGDTMSGPLILGYMAAWPVYFISNNAGTNPTINQGLSIGGNYTGGSGEVDFVDTNVGYSVAFNFYQMTSATTKNLLASLLASGELQVGTNPTAALGVATKQYVDGQLSSSVPVGFGAGAPGAATTASRSDHVHPSNFRDSNTVIVGSGDLNDVQTQGYYSVTGVTNVPPTGDSWHYLRVMVHQAGANAYIAQHATTLTFNPPQEWYRTCVNNTWSGWVRVDRAAAYIATTAPASANDGALWYENDSGLLYIRYNDGSSTQWVAIAARAEATP